MSAQYTPVLVGVGVATQRHEDPSDALEPLELMFDAVRTAGEDCGAAELLREVEQIAVPRGRWQYRNPGGAIAREIGADNAKSILSSVGVLQQSLIASACQDIASGKIGSAIVTGADAGYRMLRARIIGSQLSESEQHDEPDVKLEPAAELRHEAELAAGLRMPVGLYALIESARRASAGLSVQEHREQIARGYARFSEIAAQNPHAWTQEARSAADICNAGKKNPMQAFPYTRSHCSTWNVDQAAALLLCSEEKADALGIEHSRRVYPLGSVESNHMVPVSARRDLVECVGARIAADALYKEIGIEPEDVDLVDLYSCFPIAVDCFSGAARLPAGRDLTITGSMAFAGGPYNNYFFQATARAAELIRAKAGCTALLSCVSGVMTKQAFAMWSIDKPERGFVRLDVSDEVAGQCSALEVETEFSGEGAVVACTVVYGSGAADAYAVVLLDTTCGRRSLATSYDATTIQSIETEEWCGRKVRVERGKIICELRGRNCD